MKRYYLTIGALLFFCLSFFPEIVSAGAPLEKNNYGWMDNITNVHPHMFLTKEDIPQIKIAASSYEKATYDAMKGRVDKLIDANILFPDPLAATGESNTNHEYGFRASEAAMVYLITEDKRYLELTKLLLNKITDYYQLRVDNELNIHWYAFSQICTLCAYDWIYNDLTVNERRVLGSRLFKAVDGITWYGPGIRKSRFRENTSDYKSGCYGPSVLPWYLGLTFYGDGINDQRCVEIVKNGYDFHQQMVEFRSSMIGENGGGGTSCAQYALGYYPYAEFDFIYTFRSATGIDISKKMDYILGYLNYMDWVRLPGNREYGFGDVHHYNCLLPHRDMNAHVAEIANLYGERHPEILPVAARLLTEFNQRRPVDGIPFLRLLQKAPPKVTAEGSGGENQQRSIYFDTMGQVYMRSGVGDDDTYVLFVSGGVPTQHKHYDNNNFIIYKHGYRALDSGTRPEPGWHLSHYYARTVAHNCVTIRMPGEVMPAYWGGPAASENEYEPVPNDGGQRELLASKLLALEETPDYIYLASDATASYHADKAKLVMREFIYCMPDLFVVFDRVVSTDPSYNKSWLFHTVAKPKMSRKEFSETSQGGKTICRTLFPTNAKLEKIGGSEKQFWSDGRNWPLPVLTPEDYGYAKRYIVPPPSHPEIGHWRVEVLPGEPAGEDLFMHIFQVGDKSLKKLPKTKTFDNENTMGVAFEYNGKAFRIAFDKKADYGCEIQVTNK